MGILTLAEKQEYGPIISRAVENIYKSYGDRVSVSKKGKELDKFGRSEQVLNAEPGSTLMTLPAGTDFETYVSTNAITHFASDDAGDTDITFTLEGHTIDGDGNFTFVTQEITTNGSDGTTKTALSTPLARSTRIFVNDSSNVAGTVYVAEDVTFTGGVPQTDSAVHLMLPGVNQSLKASTTVSNNDYWIVTDLYASVLEKTGGVADVRLEVREKGEVFLPKKTFKAGDPNPLEGTFIIIPKNADVRLVAVASADNLDVSGGINGVLALVDN